MSKIGSFILGAVSALFVPALVSNLCEPCFKTQVTTEPSTESGGSPSESEGAFGRTEVELATPPQVAAGTSQRQPIPRVPDEGEIEDRVVEQLLAGLPADWITPIEEPSYGKGPTLGGVAHGEWTLTHPVNAWTDVGHYVLGARQGVWKIYDKQGDLIRVRTFVNGKIDGELRDRDDGSTMNWRTYSYRQGVLVD